MTRKLVSVLIATTILMPAAALAVPHGKPGLWTITTTMQMAAMPKMPPEVLEMMKKRGMNIPQPGQPMTSQICMTAEQAEMKPPNMDREGVKCTPKVISQTSNSATTEITCHGTMEGTGRSQISWRGDSHYEGSYSFTGTMHDRANNMSSTYTGDWVKADCGSVKPFSGKIPSMAGRPPAPH
jgi:Protein of unknown function (DUF3617)